MQILALLQTALREPPHLLACVVLAPYEQVQIPFTLPIQALHITLPVRLVFPRCRGFHGFLTHALRLVGRARPGFYLRLGALTFDCPRAAKSLSFPDLLLSSKLLLQQRTGLEVELRWEGVEECAPDPRLVDVVRFLKQRWRAR